jgi:hypothetical protein
MDMSLPSCHDMSLQARNSNVLANSGSSDLHEGIDLSNVDSVRNIGFDGFEPTFLALERDEIRI